MNATRLLLVLPLLLGISHLAAQATSELIDQLAKAKRLDHSSTGEGGEKSDTYKTYELLAAKATADELLGLASHQSPIVRGYAVWALSERQAKIDWKKLVLDHLDDTVVIEERVGCCGNDQEIGDVIFLAARAHLEQKQLLEIAERMVAGSCPPRARKWVLMNVSFGDGMLPVLRQLARSDDAAATVALARYHLDADVPILVQQLQQHDPFDDDTKFLAAAVSKDARLLLPLRNLLPDVRDFAASHTEDKLQPWLDAIAAQETVAAAALLQDVFDQATRDDARARLAAVIAAVLKAHPATVFDAIRTKVDAANNRH
jgi:hypothetical protein